MLTPWHQVLSPLKKPEIDGLRNLILEAVFFLCAELGSHGQINRLSGQALPARLRGVLLTLQFIKKSILGQQGNRRRGSEDHHDTRSVPAEWEARTGYFGLRISKPRETLAGKT